MCLCVCRGLLGSHVMVIHNVPACIQGSFTMCLWSLIMCVCVYRDLLDGHVMVIHNVFVCTQGLAGRSCDGLLLQASGSGFELVQR